MAYEIETKILNVDPHKIKSVLDSLKAKEILQTRLSVDWFQEKGTQPDNEAWFLRIKTYADRSIEVTWKGKVVTSGNTRKQREINLTVSDPVKMSDIFLAIGLEKYAHQEKDRISWRYKKWRFDLDTYPNMPSYLEIEGKDEKHIQEAIQILHLESHQTTSEGERKLILQVYGLNWYNMHF